MVFLTGIATAFFTTKALSLINKFFNVGQIVFDISSLEKNEGQLKVDFIITNFSDKISIVQLKEVKIYKIQGDEKTVLIASQKVNFDHIRLASNESHLLINVYIDAAKEDLLEDPLFELMADVDGKKIVISPFQFYNNLGVYDENRALAYKNI